MGGTGKTSLSLKIHEILNQKKIKSCFIKKDYSNQIDEQKILESNGKLFKSKKRLNSLIDDSIDEISTMAAGDVSGGGAIGFGPPNTYNPYKKRSKTSRPKVRRAKRQRRR